jgi:hypothetical protein
MHLDGGAGLEDRDSGDEAGGAGPATARKCLRRLKKRSIRLFSPNMPRQRFLEAFSLESRECGQADP